MEREEVLRKSGEENKNQDERKRTAHIEGESFRLMLVFMPGLLLVIWNRFHGLPAADVMSMF